MESGRARTIRRNVGPVSLDAVTNWPRPRLVQTSAFSQHPRTRFPRPCLISATLAFSIYRFGRSFLSRRFDEPNTTDKPSSSIRTRTSVIRFPPVAKTPLVRTTRGFLSVGPTIDVQTFPSDPTRKIRRFFSKRCSASTIDTGNTALQRARFAQRVDANRRKPLATKLARRVTPLLNCRAYIRRRINIVFKNNCSYFRRVRYYYSPLIERSFSSFFFRIYMFVVFLVLLYSRQVRPKAK